MIINKGKAEGILYECTLRIHGRWHRYAAHPPAFIQMNGEQQGTNTKIIKRALLLSDALNSFLCELVFLLFLSSFFAHCNLGIII